MHDDIVQKWMTQFIFSSNIVPSQYYRYIYYTLVESSGSANPPIQMPSVWRPSATSSKTWIPSCSVYIVLYVCLHVVVVAYLACAGIARMVINALIPFITLYPQKTCSHHKNTLLLINIIIAKYVFSHQIEVAHLYLVWASCSFDSTENVDLIVRFTTGFTPIDEACKLYNHAYSNGYIMHTPK